MGRFYIFHLTAFVAAAEQNDDRMSDLAKIHAVAWAEINFKSKYSFSNGVAFPQVAGPRTRDSCSNLSAAFAVLKRIQPRFERTAAGLRPV